MVGRVALYIDDQMTSYPFSNAHIERSSVEQIWCVVVVGKSKYLIGCIYRPNYIVNMDDMRIISEKARDQVRSGGFKDLLIMGDFMIHF